MNFIEYDITMWMIIMHHMISECAGMHISDTVPWLHGIENMLLIYFSTDSNRKQVKYERIPTICKLWTTSICGTDSDFI